MKISNIKFGIQVEDIDYHSIDDAVTVRNFIGTKRIVVVKNPTPVPAKDLLTFYQNIGDVVAQEKEVVGSGVDGLHEFVRVKRNGLFTGAEDGELEWHCAGMNRNGAEDIVAIYMNKPGVDGGDTYFSDTQTAYEDLDEETKEKIDGLKSKIVNYPEKMLVGDTFYKNVFANEQTFKAFKDIDGIAAHTKQTSRKNLVTTHPLNNKKGLHYPWSVIRGFAGIDKRESHDLYYKLKNHTLNDKYVYKHVWDQYDICLSDQHHSLHRRDAYDGDRELWRSGIWYRSENVTV